MRTPCRACETFPRGRSRFGSGGKSVLAFTRRSAAGTPEPMSKVYFYYSAMNAGKSTVLLQSSYNYHERGMRTLLFVPATDTRSGTGRIASRIGLESEAITLPSGENLLERVRAAHAE